MYREAGPQIAEVVRAAAQDEEGFSGIGPEIYTSEELLAVEQRRIFKHEWACVGRHDELPVPGDYFTTDVGLVPIIVIRRDDGRLGAMVNVCSHRLAKLTDGAGSARRFVCPYHGWSYGRDGALLRAPRMPEPFDAAACGLRPVQVETWNGFVYVNLDPDAPSLAASLGPLTALFRDYHVERMRMIHKSSEIWNCNWKIATENFLESYHLEMVHAATIGPFYPQEGLSFTAEGDLFAFHRFVSPPHETDAPSPSIVVANDELSPEASATTYVGGVFPNHLFTVAGDQITWMRTQPIDVDHTLIEWGVCGAFDIPHGTKPDVAHPCMTFLREIPQVNAEDRAIVEAVQAGARSGMVRPSRLHPNERGLLSFARFLAKRLA